MAGLIAGTRTLLEQSHESNDTQGVLESLNGCGLGARNAESGDWQQSKR
jgi:hypothetical protein